MPLRLSIPALVTALVVALGAGRADAETVLGSPDVEAAPQGFICGDCPDEGVGFRQFALSGATVEAPEDGVLVSARAYAERSGGTTQPRIAVLRPTEGIGATIVAAAELPMPASGAALREVTNLHLAVQAGDSLAFVFDPDEVNLGRRDRPSPDGAVVSFSEPCNPCGESEGTGDELLFEGILEPDADGDGLGDESQDPDGGDPSFGDDGFGFDDFGDDFGFDEEPTEEPPRLGLVRVLPGREGATILVLAVPRAGRLSALATVAARRSGRSRGQARKRLEIASGEARARRAGRVRLRLRPSRAGRRLLARPGRLRTRLEVTFRPATGRRQKLTRPLALGARPTDRP
jgi:hypothetical protein